MPVSDEEYLAKLYTKIVDYSDPDKCWIWNGVLTEGGYGQFCFKKKIVAPHRYLFELENGKIMSDNFVCRTCKITECVNPRHMILKTKRYQGKEF